MKKRTYFIVIDIFKVDNTVLCKTITDVSTIVDVHRNTIDLSKRIIYGHHVVLERSV
jgi:hypothetical protein